MFARSLTSLALAGALVLAGAVAASAQGVPELTADPASVAVGEETTITATGLGGLETASFGLDGTPGGTLIEPTTDQAVTQYDAPVENGQAIVRFRSSEAGAFTVAVGTGETVAATVEVTVTAAPSPTPAPTVTVTAPAPTPEPSMTTQGGGSSDPGIPGWAVALIVVLAVLVVGAIIAIVVLVARRRGPTAPTS